MTATATTLASPPNSCCVYTPQPLADAIARRLGDNETALWLEPSVGPGVFLISIAALEVPASRVTALDIALDVCEHRHLAQVLGGQDFVRWALNTPAKFDRVVGNPPYLKSSQVPEPLRQAALQVCVPWGGAVSKKSNYWLVFVCAILKVLRAGGSLGLVLPSAWEYADYSQEMRERLPGLFRRFEVHRSHKSLFGKVGEGAVVLIAEGYGQAHERASRHEHADMASLIAALSQAADAPHAAQEAAPLVVGTGPVRQLKDVAQVRIGAVTGDAKYFLFDEKRRQDSGMPLECFKPILTRAKHLNAPQVTRAYWESLRDKGERVWLFSPTPQSLCDHAVRAYLDLPPDKGGCNRDAYKVKNRKSWHSVGLPGEAHGFLSGMSVSGPFICMNAMPDLTASNTLYVVEFHRDIIEAERYAWALSLLSSHSRMCVLKLLRLYTDGLQKHEPKDLLRVELPTPKSPRSLEEIKETYRNAVCLHLKGHQEAARRIADENIEPQL